MRYPRLKLADTSYAGEPPGTVYHVWNRIAGCSGDRPMGDREKLKLIEMMNDLDELYCVKALSFAVMDNHFHIMAFAPATPPSPEEAIHRFESYYGDTKPLPWNAEETLPERLRDLSCYMHDLQFRFTCWYNRTRPARRRGALWGGRFKSAILDARHMFNALGYIALNPFEAGMVKDPADYRYSSWGMWSATGKHPFEEYLTAHLPRLFGLDRATASADEIRGCMKDRIARLVVCAKEKRRRGNISGDGCHWVYGQIIGSEEFVRRVAAMAQEMLAPGDPKQIAEHRLGRLPLGSGEDESLFSWRKPRAAVLG